MTGKTLAREYLCSVVRSALLSEPLSDIPEGTDKVFLVKLAYRNSVQVILYLAFKDKPGALPQEYMSKLERSYKAAILRESAQQNELNFIRKAFAENNIDFMCSREHTSKHFILCRKCALWWIWTFLSKKRTFCARKSC